MGHFQGGDRREGGFRGGNGGGGRPNFQKKSFGGGFRDREASMHKAICSECSKSCEVPFRPTGDKPVYCSDCFSNKRDMGDRAPRRDFENREPKRDYNSDRQASNNSFAKQTQTPSYAGDDTSKQLKDISMKLDRLIMVMEKLSQSKVNTAPAVKATPAPAIVTLKTVIAKASPKVEVKKAPVAKVIAKKVVATKDSAKKVVAKKKK